MKHRFYILIFGLFLGNSIFAIDPVPYAHIEIDKNIHNIDSIYSVQYYSRSVVMDTIAVKPDVYNYTIHKGIIRIKLKEQAGLYPDSVSATRFGSVVKISRKKDMLRLSLDKYADFKRNMTLFLSVVGLMLLKMLIVFLILQPESKSLFFKKYGLFFGIVFLFIFLASFTTVILFWILLALIFIVSVIPDTILLNKIYYKKGLKAVVISDLIVLAVCFLLIYLFN